MPGSLVAYLSTTKLRSNTDFNNMNVNLLLSNIIFLVHTFFIMKLVNFLVKCRNERVTVEMKDGSQVTGTVKSVSPTMNVILTQADLIHNESKQHLDSITIRGNMVRLVILPDELNLDAILSDAIFRPKKKSSKTAPKTPIQKPKSRTKGF